MKRKRLAIVTTHPIQYQAPWFRELAKCPLLDLEVLFCHDATSQEQANAGFGVEFQWDIPILEGYRYRFLKNVAQKPSIARFRGLDVPEIKEIIAHERYDAVLVSGWNYKAAWQTFLACWTTRTPVMVRSDSHLYTERHPLKRAVKYPLYRWFISRMDACLAVGTWSQEYFRHYGASSDRIFLVPHIVDEERFNKDYVHLRHSQLDLRNERDIPASAIVFGFCGKLIPKKRPLDFINALSLVQDNKRMICGLIVGDGPLRKDCSAVAEKSGIPIYFTGFLNQKEIAKAYVMMDVLVLPSDGGETWGLVVNEAMFFGRPCIVSDKVGCGPDLIVQGKTGDIYPTGNTESLARLIRQYSSDPAALESKGDYARNYIKLNSVDAAVNGVLQAMERVSRKH